MLCEGRDARSDDLESSPDSKGTVLVIDDDETIRFLFRFALERKGYQVFLAGNGSEGIQLLASIPKPCLILLDLMMPVMNGWEFMQEIDKFAQWKEIPIAILTAFPLNSSTNKAKEIITKPVDLEFLLETIRRWCD